jgi:hypothetical protein
MKPLVRQRYFPPSADAEALAIYERMADGLEAVLAAHFADDGEYGLNLARRDRTTRATIWRDKFSANVELICGPDHKREGEVRTPVVSVKLRVSAELDGDLAAAAAGPTSHFPGVDDSRSGCYTLRLYIIFSVLVGALLAGLINMIYPVGEWVILITVPLVPITWVAGRVMFSEMLYKLKARWSRKNELLPIIEADWLAFLQALAAATADELPTASGADPLTGVPPSMPL